MKLRDFLKSIPLLPVAAVAKVKPKPFGKRVFPRKPDEFIGKICVPHCTSGCCPPPSLIIREWDEDHDRYEDKYIPNPRRNKYWGEPLGIPGKREIVCITWYPPYCMDDMDFYEPS